MRIIVTGQSGFLGRSVVSTLYANGDWVVTPPDYTADAMIHLAWAGLPNYQSAAQFANVDWQYEIIKSAADNGITNIVVAGTSLENAEKPPAYALAKRELYRRLRELPIDLKWIRFPSLYGADQPSRCLYPSLLRAVERRDKKFHVAPTAKVFIDVVKAAQDMRIALLLSDQTDPLEYANKPERVADFCRRMVPKGAIELVEDYPLESWEKEAK